MQPARGSRTSLTAWCCVTFGVRVRLSLSGSDTRAKANYSVCSGSNRQADRGHGPEPSDGAVTRFLRANAEQTPSCLWESNTSPAVLSRVHFPQ